MGEGVKAFVYKNNRDDVRAAQMDAILAVEKFTGRKRFQDDAALEQVFAAPLCIRCGNARGQDVAIVADKLIHVEPICVACAEAPHD